MQIYSSQLTEHTTTPYSLVTLDASILLVIGRLAGALLLPLLPLPLFLHNLTSSLSCELLMTWLLRVSEWVSEWGLRKVEFWLCKQIRDEVSLPPAMHPQRNLSPKCQQLQRAYYPWSPHQSYLGSLVVAITENIMRTFFFLITKHSDHNVRYLPSLKEDVVRISKSG